MPKFRTLVLPYIIPSMLYKLLDKKSNTPKDNRPKPIQVTDIETNITGSAGDIPSGNITTIYLSLRDLNNNSPLSRSGVVAYLREKKNNKTL